MVARRKVSIRGGIWHELFLPFQRGLARQRRIEAGMGRSLDLYDDREYDVAADCYGFPKATRTIQTSDGPEEVTAPQPTLFEGRVGTGKTFGLALFLHLLAEEILGIRILVIRQTFESLTDSFKATFEDDVLPSWHPFLNEQAVSRSHRKEYIYDNGSRIVLRGFDRPGRTLSTEWDVIYFMEVTDDGVEIVNVEQLARGLRGNRCPFKLFLMDCNPGSQYHWANLGCIEGRFRRVVTTWQDNPALWDATSGTWTRKGLDYTQQVKSIYTGHNFERYVEGRWVTVEGGIWPNFDLSRHVVDGVAAQDERGTWRIHLDSAHRLGPQVMIEHWYGAVDWGMNAPGTFQVWGLDYDRRMWLVEEVYKTDKDPDWWASVALKAHEKYRLRRIICDSASPPEIAVFNRRFGFQNNHPERIAIPVNKSKGFNNQSFVPASIGLVRTMFEDDCTGNPRLNFLRGSLREGPDPTLRGKPTRLVEEIPSYVWAAQKPGQQVKEQPQPGVADHGCDAMRYFVWYVNEKFALTRPRKRLDPESIGARVGGFDEYGRIAS